MNRPLRTTAIAAGLALALLLPLPGRAAEEPIAVIVHPSQGISVLGASDLRAVFQTKRTNWDDGASAAPVNLPPKDALRRGFDAAVLGLDPDRVARYWIDRKIRGGARPPKELSSTGLVLKVVARKKGAVGYVPMGQVDDSVRVVAKIVDGNLEAP